MLELPQANRAYLGLLAVGSRRVAARGQLRRRHQKSFEGMSFAFNGSGTTAPTVRIEGIIP
jgi:hypothetical protein